jgi:hypothetical protein
MGGGPAAGKVFLGGNKFKSKSKLITNAHVLKGKVTVTNTTPGFTVRHWPRWQRAMRLSRLWTHIRMALRRFPRWIAPSL